MSISSEITSIGENLKKDYQSIANLGADLTNVDKNIENIAELLDGVYDRLPKTEFEEGESVTLENTLKGKLDYDNGVVVIGQTEQDSTQGYQLIHQASFGTFTNNGITFTQLSDGSIKVNGTANENGADINLLTGDRSVVDNSNNILIEANQNYMFSGNPNGDLDTISMVMHTKSYGNVIRGAGNPNSFSFTSDVNMAAVRIIVKSGVTINNMILYPMLETGTTAHDWEKYTGGQASPNPSYPQTINSVTGNQDVVVSGKNYYINNFTTQTVNGVTITRNNDGSITLNGTSNVSGFTDIYSIGTVSNYEIFELTNGTYTLSGSGNNNVLILAVLRDSSNINTIVTGGETSGTYNLSNIVSARLFIRIIGGASFTNYTIYPQLEPGSTATTYEPYITPTSYQISLGDIELCKIGTYQDYIYKSGDKWYVHKEIGKQVFTGANSESWDRSGTNVSGEYRFANNSLSELILKPSDNNTRATGLCNRLTSETSNNTYTQKQGFSVTTTGILVVFINSLKTETGANFKTWLTSNNLEFYYALATPTDTEITDTTLINQVKALYNAHSLNGTTIITSNGNLPMIIKVRGLKGE